MKTLHHMLHSTWAACLRPLHRLRRLSRLRNGSRGSVFVEYLLLLTIVGIGVICGLSTVRAALITELGELAAAIDSISCPPPP